MNRHKFKVEQQDLVPFAEQIEKSDLENTILGVDESKRIVIMVEYRVEQLEAIASLIELTTKAK